MTTLRRARSVFHVVLPVVVAAILVFLAVVNMALVKSWRGEYEDGVRWGTVGANVVAMEIDRHSSAERAGIQRNDVLLMVDGQEVSTAADLQAILHRTTAQSRLHYVLQRQSEAVPVAIDLQPMPLARAGLYYSVALVGILAIVVGASVRLRRPVDRATLHFFWLTVAFFGTMSFTPSGAYSHLDYFFDWADVIARLALPPLFLHFAFVFPERAEPASHGGFRKWGLVLVYVPAFVLGITRALVTLPRCPNWSAEPNSDFTNARSSNFGCADATNLGHMVANPADLASGRPLGDADAVTAVSAVTRYYQDKIQLPAAATLGPIQAPSSAPPPATGGPGGPTPGS